MTATYAPSPNSLKVYETRYLDQEAKTPDDLWKRVSGGNDTYYRLMRDGLFLPNSPTLFNMGTHNGGTLSACFVFDIQDCLLGDWPEGGYNSPFPDSIAGTAFKAMAVAKAGGGVGYYLGNIREEGADVNSTHKKACGPVTVLRWLNTLNWLITQGGKRALAQMGVLPCWHKDVRKFVHCKDENPHELSSFNISVSWLHEWIKQIDWDKVGQANLDNDAAALWWEQCQSAHGTGCPGMQFWDTINAVNLCPHLGDMNATNPCGEVPNRSDEPCNLGSTVLKRFLKRVGIKWVFMWDEFKQRLREMLWFMDDILDWNTFPHPDITKMALATRKLGLGVMGYAATLNTMNVPYDSQEAVDFGSEVAKTVQDVTHDESEKLAVMKGVYPAWETAPDNIKKIAPRRRNETTTSIAPTGTIYLLADAETSSIEPYFSLNTLRTTGEGIKLQEQIQSHSVNGGHVPKTANQIPLEWHVKHQAAFQRYTDLGVSKTINMANSATVKDVSDAYRLMWELGCKGGTIYRDGCRPDQVLRETKTKLNSVFVEVSEITQPNGHSGRRKLPRERVATITKFSIGGLEGYLIPGVYADGTLGEIFLELTNDGSTLSGFAKSFAKTFSRALQDGTKLEDLVRLHKNSVFEPRGMTGDTDVPSCTSLPDYIVRKLEVKFLKPVETLTVVTTTQTTTLSLPPENGKGTAYESGTGMTGQYCPQCSSEMVRQGATCMVCIKRDCGYSKC